MTRPLRAVPTPPEDEVENDKLYADLVDPDGDDGSEESSGVLPGAEPQTVEAPMQVDAVPYAVDPPVGSMSMKDLTGLDFAGRQAVLPKWMKGKAEAKFVARFVALWTLHQITFHLTRLPKYVGKVVVRLFVGSWRAWFGYLGWLLDRDAAPLRAEARRKNDTDQHLKLTKERDQHVHTRLLISAAYIAPALFVALAVYVGHRMAWFSVPWWIWGAAVLAAVVALVRNGAPADRPLFDVAVVASGKPIRLTSRMVNDALGALGNSRINDALKNGKMSVDFVAPITRDGPGWAAHIQLPRGVTVSDIMEKREALASGLRRPLGCVWPEPVGEDNPGRMCLWVGDQDLSKTPQPPWPLLKSGQVDLFKDIPFGTDQRGRKIEMCLMFASMLIGAMPRFGKTFALRLVLLAVALDPRAELRIWELKGTGDLGPLEPVSHRYGSGADEETLDAAMADLRDIYEELNRRAKRIKALDRALVPENKTTPEVASKRSFGLFPLVMAVDECQELFSHPDYKDEAARLAEAILKRGPAMGVIAIFATQRPDAKSVPTGVSSNALIRFCLKVMGQVENDMVLGTSKYKAGIRATMFSKRDKGIGWLDGHAEDPQITRTYYVDGPTAEKIVARARAARVAAGTVTGHAVGETAEDRESYSLLDDVVTVFATSERLHSETIIEGLIALRPAAYEGWTPTTFAQALKAISALRTVQMMIDGRNKYGLRREDLDRALADRKAREIDAGEVQDLEPLSPR